jgi:hypothetical protein
MGRELAGSSKPIIASMGQWWNHRRFRQIRFPDHTTSTFVGSIDRFGRRSKISTAPDTLVLACLYTVSLGPSLGQAVDAFPTGLIFTLFSNFSSLCR